MRRDVVEPLCEKCYRAARAKVARELVALRFQFQRRGWALRTRAQARR